jgi:hypothetical protein
LNENSFILRAVIKCSLRMTAKRMNRMKESKIQYNTIRNAIITIVLFVMLLHRLVSSLDSDSKVAVELVIMLRRSHVSAVLDRLARNRIRLL